MSGEEISGEETARSGAATPSGEDEEAQGGIGRGRTVDFERSWRERPARWEFDELGVHRFGGDDEEAKRVWREERARRMTCERVKQCQLHKQMVKDYDCFAADHDGAVTRGGANEKLRELEEMQHYPRKRRDRPKRLREEYSRQQTFRELGATIQRKAARCNELVACK